METRIIGGKKYRESLVISWSKLNLIEQLGNIGSEVGRAAKWCGVDEKSFQGAVGRTFELFELTLIDGRWNNYEHKKVKKMKELFADAVLGGYEYKSNLKDLEKYFMLFALKAQS